MAVLTRNNIVTNGLVLYLDAANRQSYTSGSTTWSDMSGNRNSGSLVNGPTFDNINGGSIVFDGVNDYVRLASNITISTDWTIMTWVQSNQTASAASYLKMLYDVNSPGTRDYFSFEWNNRLNGVNSSGTSFVFQTAWTPGLPLDRSFFMLTVMGRASIMEVYQNTIKTTVNAPITGSITLNSFMNSQNTFPPGGKMSTLLIYNRALLPAEITQNYNATKTRFNLT